MIFIAFREWLIYLLWIKLFLFIEKNIHSRWRLESSLIRKETKRNIDIILSWALCILRCLAGFDAGHGTTNFSGFVYPDGGPYINKLWCWRGAWPYLIDEFVEYLNENGIIQNVQLNDLSQKRWRGAGVVICHLSLVWLNCDVLWYYWFITKR